MKKAVWLQAVADKIMFQLVRVKDPYIVSPEVPSIRRLVKELESV